MTSPAVSRSTQMRTRIFPINAVEILAEKHRSLASPLFFPEAEGCKCQAAVQVIFVKNIDESRGYQNGSPRRTHQALSDRLERDAFRFLLAAKVLGLSRQAQIGKTIGRGQFAGASESAIGQVRPEVSLAEGRSRLVTKPEPDLVDVSLWTEEVLRHSVSSHTSPKPPI